METSLPTTSQTSNQDIALDASRACRHFVEQLNAAGPYNQDIHNAIASKFIRKRLLGTENNADSVVRDIESALRVLKLYRDEYVRSELWTTDTTAIVDGL